MIQTPPRSPQIWNNKICLGERKLTEREVVNSIIVFANRYSVAMKDHYLSIIFSDDLVNATLNGLQLSSLSNQEKYNYIKRIIHILPIKESHRIRKLVDKVEDCDFLISASEDCNDHLSCLGFLVEFCSEFMYFLLGVNVQAEDQLCDLFFGVAQVSSVYIYGLLILMLPHVQQLDPWVSSMDEGRLTETLTFIIDSIVDSEYSVESPSNRVSPALIRDFFRDLEVDEFVDLLLQARRFKLTGNDYTRSALLFWHTMHVLNPNKVTKLAVYMFSNKTT